MKVAFIADQLPQHSFSGATRYHHDFVEAVLAAGHEIEVWVTGAVAGPAHPDWRFRGRIKVRALHWSLTSGGLFMPKSFPASARTAVRGVGWTRKRRIECLRQSLDTRQLAFVAHAMSALKPDAVFFDTVWRLTETPKGTRRIVIAPDCLHLRSTSLLAAGTKLLNAVTKSEEAALLQQCDAVAAITDCEAEQFRAMAPSANTEVVRPLVHAAQFTPAAGGSGIFLLATKSAHNTTGLRWFLDEVWPLLRETEPAAQLHIVGDIAGQFQQAPSAGVRFHGTATDLQPIAQQCRIAIAPLIAGSGFKIKLVDYLALGLPTVATSIAAEGLPSPAMGAVCIADDPQQMAAVVRDCLQNDARVQEMRDAIPAMIDHFSLVKASVAIGRLLRG